MTNLTQKINLLLIASFALSTPTIADHDPFSGMEPTSAAVGKPTKQFSVTVPSNIPPEERKDWEVVNVANIEVDLIRGTDPEALQAALDAIARGERVTGEAARIAQDLLEQASADLPGAASELEALSDRLEPSVNEFEVQARRANVDQFDEFAADAVGTKIEKFKNQAPSPRVRKQNVPQGARIQLPAIPPGEQTLSYKAPQKALPSSPTSIVGGISKPSVFTGSSNPFPDSSADDAYQVVESERRYGEKAVVYRSGKSFTNNTATIGDTDAIPDLQGSTQMILPDSNSIRYRRKIAKNLAGYLRQYRKGKKEKGLAAESLENHRLETSPLAKRALAMNFVANSSLLSPKGKPFKIFDSVSEEVGISSQHSLWLYYTVLVLAWTASGLYLYFLLRKKGWLTKHLIRVRTKPNSQNENR